MLILSSNDYIVFAAIGSMLISYYAFEQHVRGKILAGI